MHLDNNGTVNYFDFYCKYVTRELCKIPLSNDRFEDVFKFQFSSNFADMKFDSAAFDLVIASKVLHYKSISEPYVFFLM